MCIISQPNPRALWSMQLKLPTGAYFDFASTPRKREENCHSADKWQIWGLWLHLGKSRAFWKPSPCCLPTIPTVKGCTVSKLGLRNSSQALTLKYWLCLLSPVFPHLVRELNAGLHVMVLLLLFLALALSLVSMGFAILNMVQVPYRAVSGPGGICLWNVLAGKEGPWGEKFMSTPSPGWVPSRWAQSVKESKCPMSSPHFPGSVTFLLGMNVLFTESCRVSVTTKSQIVRMCEWLRT